MSYLDQPIADNLDEIILEEKRLVAQEHFLDAWLAAMEDGIDADIIAKAMTAGAILQLAKSLDQQSASDLVLEIQQMEMRGEFVPEKTLQ